VACTRGAVLVLLAAAAAAADAGERAMPRYRIESAQAERRAEPAGRFVLEAHATRLPAAGAEARFTLLASPKATDGTCGPDADALFAHGFE
jgi:hypothetical protein